MQYAVTAAQIVGSLAIHGVSSHPDGLVFTDINSHQVKLLANDQTISIIAGTGECGHCDDGMAARFTQPTALCTEMKSVFTVDSAVGCDSNSFCSTLS